MATWDTTYEELPAGTLESGGLGAGRIRSWKDETGSRFGQEHNWNSSSSFGQGYHKAGATRAYYQAAVPTLRPDGLTTLDTSDAGRLSVYSTTSEITVWDGTTISNLAEDSVIDQSGGNHLKVKILEIGRWNMYIDATPDSMPLHGVSLSCIRHFDVVIKSDIGSLYPLTYGQGTTAYASGLARADTLELYCTRSSTGFFATSAFTGSGNRGYVYIWYAEA
jgi:hypothetical protein